MIKALLLVPVLAFLASQELYASVSAFAGDSVATTVATEDTAKYKPDTSKVAQQVLPFEEAAEVFPIETDELIMDRMSCLQGTIPLTFNPYVRQFVDYFTIKNRKYTRRMLERENVYFPLFEKYLAKYNMPQELKYLAVVESGLNPKAVSRTKAMGLWQFMAPTGRDFKLTQNQYIDERLDPEKSTDAACRYLKMLHNMFGDWQVALAAYNCGQGNVKKAIKKAGGVTDFWAIFPHLPLETRGYVPSFIAVNYAMNHATDHNLFADTLLYAHDTDTLHINDYLDLERFSEHICVSTSQLMDLNPALKVKYVPEHFRNFPLKVPAHCSEFIAHNRGWLLDSCRRGSGTPEPMIALLPDNLKPEASAKNTRKFENKKSLYVVRRGDVLGKIADDNGVSLSNLKKWNKLKSNKIMPGQKLVVMKTVPVSPKKQAVATQPTQLAKAPAAKDKPAATIAASPEKTVAQTSATTPAT
ncbi:MAG: LysM peptidoglycan-binding domain-containing protein, partial [Sphingobacteriales bacterium]